MLLFDIKSKFIKIDNEHFHMMNDLHDSLFLVRCRRKQLVNNARRSAQN